ncbi:phosphatase domain-containing protein [Streptosporangium sandarakinum]|uniref:phosphatase domain-containing protein n=1 Tax=Streptosporangium sandarakinum TaxID=1260955 RepID=UPI00379DB16D
MNDSMDGTTARPVSGPPLTGAFRLPDGTWIRGRGLRHPLPEGPIPDFGLYLGSDGLRRRHEGELQWPHAWIQWPDFLLPRDRDMAVQQIRALHERARAGAAAEVACGGGVGRTGTVVACLAILAGLDPADAITWTREHHHHRAVETPWQRRWVLRFPPSLRPDSHDQAADRETSR